MEHHHALFYKLWELGYPIFTDSVETAAVQLNGANVVNFLFNPDFWSSLTDYERQFVICHECLHVILNHGVRVKKMTDTVNQALDVVVNHTLVNRFGFDRSKLSMGKSLCWVDTIWPGQNMPDNESFEYYIQRFPKNGSKAELLDSHEGLDGISGEALNEVLKSLGKSLSDLEKQSLGDLIEKHFAQEEGENTTQEAGTSAGSSWLIVQPPVIRKKKWESIIKKWSKKYDRAEFNDIEQWARINRRFAALTDDLLLPTEMEEEHEEEGKIKVWFFQDTSGSCRNLAKRFFAAARSLNPKRFDVKMCCFDTKVYETTLESGKLYGFGGTYFHILENYVQAETKKNNEKYPEAIFVITDGYGSSIQPEQPKSWYWFLSTKFSNYIPKECNIFNLKDFE